jgi:serine phosphatase RsbU (regulator of sigma subunit)
VPGTLGERRFTDEDVSVLQIVADRVGFASQSRRLAIERAAATVLQRSLLPSRLPMVTGLEIAARYVSAEQGGSAATGMTCSLFPAVGCAL